jgi:hypothetical protein
LKLGSTYIFIVGYWPNEGVYLIGPYGFNYFALTDNSALTREELWVLAERSAKVIELKEAYPLKRLAKNALKKGLGYNAYASCCLDASGDLIDDTVQIANEKKGLPKTECVTRLTPEIQPTQTPEATPIPTTINRPKPPLPSVEPVRTPPPPPALPTM